jgi:hypothetical protein
MAGKLSSYLLDGGPFRCCIDQWQSVARNTRQFLKGWGGNLGKERKVFKTNILAQIEVLDRVADSVGLDEDGWATRYHLEDQILGINMMEEEYWRQRSRVQWTVQGDACMRYFHAIANGRRRKCLIPQLITDVGEIDDQRALMEHIYGFYKGLMGTKGDPARFSLGVNLWEEEQHISEGENRELELTFTPEELDEVLASMKPDSAPGPDGLPVVFFKRFWGTLKGPVLQLLNDFTLGRVDIARLNFGIILLIPKIKGADAIRQF